MAALRSAGREVNQFLSSWSTIPTGRLVDTWGCWGLGCYRSQSATYL